ncbi:unnamed protein product [marine sediment metagenome]|uniref:Uncharacterized protein n=1 Tax=marine sediment metagenome TaxID=412755 RepID=X0WRE0_9ZZZZ
MENPNGDGGKKKPLELPCEEFRDWLHKKICETPTSEERNAYTSASIIFNSYLASIDGGVD